MASMLPNLFALVELLNSKRRLAQEDRKIEQDEKNAYTANLSAAADRIRAAPAEARAPMIELYAGELGLDRDQLTAMALGTPESIEAIRAKKVAAGAEGVDDGVVASMTLAGALPGAIAEDAVVNDFLRSSGVGEAEADGPLGAGSGSQLFQTYMARRFAGMSPGQLAQDQVLANTPQEELKRMQDIRGDLMLGATGTESARQANAQIGLGYANLDLGRDRFEHDSEVDLSRLALDERLGAAAALGRGGGSQDRMGAVRTIIDAQSQLSAGYNTPAGQRAFAAAMYNSFIELGYSKEQAMKLAGIEDPSMLQPGNLDATLRRIR